MESLIFVYCYQILNNTFGVMLKSQPDDQIIFFYPNLNLRVEIDIIQCK